MTAPIVLSDLIFHSAERAPEAPALSFRQERLSYAELAEQIQKAAHGLLELGLGRNERVAVYLPKRLETVIALFAIARAGGVFVPVNPLLKPEQVAYILKDCNVRVLITANDRANLLAPVLAECHDLHTVVTLDEDAIPGLPTRSVVWESLLKAPAHGVHRCIDTDMAAILYTSGSTGKPKGVVLSHRNMIVGAQSVASYLGNGPHDRILAVLPLSFDAGFSQLTTAFWSGASAVVMDYLLPRDVIRTAARETVTGLTAVPPLWVQLAQLEWPPEVVDNLRYLATTGGRMPGPTVATLRERLPKTQVFLMYGLTEAFRSTFLPPEEVERRPDSIGKAIPNAEIMVVREDGSPCAPGEPGELVHRGSLVSLGYWNDPAKTAERFKPAPGQPAGIVHPELAVWSGDTVRADEDGFLYFVGRKDDMIKTSGYRVSPTEVEEVIYASGLVAEAAAIGIAHRNLGEAVVAVVQPHDNQPVDTPALLNHCKQALPNFMVPMEVVSREALPRNPNGKIDRKRLVADYQNLFEEHS